MVALRSGAQLGKASIGAILSEHPVECARCRDLRGVDRHRGARCRHLAAGAPFVEHRQEHGLGAVYRPFIVYMETSFNDGSAIWEGCGAGSWPAQQNRRPEKARHRRRRQRPIRGAKGEGTLTGTRMMPLPGQGAEIVNELSFNIKK
jgi:hypothetical protein